MLGQGLLRNIAAGHVWDQYNQNTDFLLEQLLGTLCETGRAAAGLLLGTEANSMY